MATVYHGVALVDHLKRTGGSEYRSGLEDAVSAEIGYAFSNAENIRQDTAWRPDDTEPDNARILYRFAERQRVGAVAIAGLEDAGEHAAMRVRWGSGWAEKPALDTGAGMGVTNDVFDEPASWTLSVLFQIVDGVNFPANALIAGINQGAAVSASTLLCGLYLRSTNRHLRVRYTRLSGAHQQLDIDAGIADGKPHQVDLAFTDNGSGGAGVVYIDRVQAGTFTSTDATTAATGLRLVTGAASDNVARIGRVGWFDAPLTAAALQGIGYDDYTGDEHDLEEAWNINDKSGTSAAAVVSSPANDLTVTDSWTAIAHPSPGRDSGYVPVWIPWQSRPSLSGHGTCNSGMNLRTAPTTAVGFLYRATPGLTGEGFTLLYLGNSTSDYDWHFDFDSGGLMRSKLGRIGGAGTTELVDTSSTLDGEVHRAVLILKIHAATLYIDGVEVATATPPAYSHDTSVRLGRGASTSWDCGGVVVLHREATVAEVDGMLTGTAPPIPSSFSAPDCYLWLPMLEGTGPTVDNKGTAGSDGDLTIGAGVDWGKPMRNPTNPADLGTLTDLPNHVAWDLAPGADVETDEVLVELYDPEAATLTVYSLFAYGCEWPEAMSQGGQDQGLGPEMDYSGSGVAVTSPDDTGRRRSKMLTHLRPAEAARIEFAVLEASKTRRADSTSELRPVGLLYRAEDRWRWPHTCALVDPEPPSVSLDGSNTSWETGTEIAGRERKYGSIA